MTSTGPPPSAWTLGAEPLPEPRSLEGDRRADVVVVGAGYTGLSAALHLAERGADVVVLDAAEPGWGASGRNGGQVIPGLKHDPDELERLAGPVTGRCPGSFIQQHPNVRVTVTELAAQLPLIHVAQRTAE